MELNKNDGEVCTDSIHPQAGEESAGEIELYDELIAFADVSPEALVRLESGSEPSPEPLEGSADYKVQAHAKFEMAESESLAAETPSTTWEEAEQNASADWTPTDSPIQSVESVTTAPAGETDCDSEVLEESSDTGALPVEGPGPSGPSSGLSVPQEIVYTGSLSRGVCLACGAESGADDLFCLACGDFVDGVGSTLPSSRICGECKERIDAEEIFCPWCGSAMQAQR